MSHILLFTGRSSAPAGTAQQGISLIELMISITLGLLVVGAMSTLFINTSSSHRDLERTTNILEDGHYTLDVLKSELALAGYYGTILDPALVSGQPCLPSATNCEVVNGTNAIPTSAQLQANDLPCSTNLANWAASFAIAAHGSNQTELNSQPTTIPCVDNLRKPNTDAIFIQRASTCQAGFAMSGSCTTGLTQNSPYLQVSGCGTEYNGTAFAAMPFVLSLVTTSVPNAGAPGAFTLRNRLIGSTPNCDVAGTAPILKYYRSIYYIGQDNGLYRLDVDPTSAATPPGTPVQIAGGIDNMQLEYGIDDGTTDGTTACAAGSCWANDGAPDRFSSTPIAADWPNVMGVRVSLLVRAGNTTTGYQDAKSYFLGDICSLPSSGAGTCPASSISITRSAAEQSYRRKVFTSYVAFVSPTDRRQ